MHRRSFPFLVLCFVAATGCASAPPPTPQAALPMVLVLQAPWRLPNPPNVQLRPPTGVDTRTSLERVTDAVEDYQEFATDLNQRVERLLAQTPPAPMPSCQPHCSAHGCSCR